MIRALLDGDKLLEAVHGAEHARYALVALGRNAGIVGMAGHADLVLRRHRDDAIQKVGDAFPEGVGIHLAGTGQGRIGMAVFEAPGAVGGIAAARRASCAEHAQDAHVVFDRRNASGGAVADQRLHGRNIAVAFRALGEHDGGVPLAIDVAGGEEGRRQAIDGDAVLLGQVAHALEFVHGGIQAAIGDGGVAANVTDAVAGEVFQMCFGGGRALAAEFHASGRGGSRGNLGGQSAAERHGGRTGRDDKFPAVHLEDSISPGRVLGVRTHPVWAKSPSAVGQSAKVSAESCTICGIFRHFSMESDVQVAA